MNMFSKIVVQKALRRTWKQDYTIGTPINKVVKGEDSLVSRLIYDVFGGEILKTHKEKGWHFYNRINGERLDFAGSEKKVSIEDEKFEDIPSTPAETSDYFDRADYLTFFMRFVKSFEEAVGLNRYQPSTSG
jgi:hypothetical protein